LNLAVSQTVQVLCILLYRVQSVKYPLENVCQDRSRSRVPGHDYFHPQEPCLWSGCGCGNTSVALMAIQVSLHLAGYLVVEATLYLSTASTDFCSIAAGYQLWAPGRQLLAWYHGYHRSTPSAAGSCHHYICTYT